MRKWIVSAALFLVATGIMTYPSAIHWMTSLRDPSDPVLNVWILAWNADSILSGWDVRAMPIFYPLKNMLFLSESLIPQTLLFTPIYFLTHNPVAAYNA